MKIAAAIIIMNKRIKIKKDRGFKTMVFFIYFLPFYQENGIIKQKAP